MKPLEELSLVDKSNNWLTFELKTIDDKSIQVTLREDRLTAMMMEATFRRHQGMDAILLRLQGLIEPEIPLRWEITLKDGNDTGSTAGPVRLRDVLFVTTGNYLHAIGFDGGLRWSFEGDWRDPPKLPAVGDNLVFFNSLKHKVRALDAESGAVRWEFAPGGEFDKTPLFEGTRVYLINNQRRSEKITMCALDAESGAIAWSRALPTKPNSPSISNGRLYAWMDRGMFVSMPQMAKHVGILP